MWRDEYVTEKLRELEAQRPHTQPQHSTSERRRPLRPLARFTGRTLRRLGESLELWATPSAGPDARWESERYWQRQG